MNFGFWLIIFIFGTCLGSFLNCIIYRLENRQSFLKGRSFCPNCQHQLTFFDLMPILSFVILRGKCRYCGKKISWQYPAVEIAAGILFLLIFLRFTVYPVWPSGTLPFIIYLFIISSLLIIIFVYDLKHYIIPDKVIYPAIGLVFLYRLFESFGFNVSSFLPAGQADMLQVSRSFLGFLLTGISAGAFFFLLWLCSQGKWMGLGDVKLAFFIGLFLGLPNVLAAMFLAFFIGAIIGTGLIIGGKKTLKSQVPFGPFLIAGTFLALFWGREIINWYLNLVT